VTGKSQIIVNQLDHLYSLYDHEKDTSLERSFSHFSFAHIYDFLEAHGKLVSYAPEIKNKLWKLAKIEVNYQKRAWIKVKSKEKDPKLVKWYDKMLKDELTKFYKSYLVRKQLFDMRRIEGKDMILENVETGKEVKMLNFI